MSQKCFLEHRAPTAIWERGQECGERRPQWGAMAGGPGRQPAPAPGGPVCTASVRSGRGLAHCVPWLAPSDVCPQTSAPVCHASSRPPRATLLVCPCLFVRALFHADLMSSCLTQFSRSLPWAPRRRKKLTWDQTFQGRRVVWENACCWKPPAFVGASWTAVGGARLHNHVVYCPSFHMGK